MPFNTPGPRASIDPHSDRAVVWFNIFGTLDDIPVTKYLPDVVDLPGRPACDVYRLDLDNLVVSCCLCNHIKAARTPEQAGMALMETANGR